MTLPRRVLKQLFSSHRNYCSIRDTDSINALQAELIYEQSSNPFQEHQGGSLGDFVLDWDAPKSRDVVLRRNLGTGEEIAISALLGSETFEEEAGLPRKAHMKVCITKPGLNSVLQFHCDLFSRGVDGSEFNIRNAYYLQSRDCLKASNYRGPLFSCLDPELQKAFKEYLIGRGIAEQLTSFLLLHLHQKEQSQYVDWLQRLQTFIRKDA